MRISDWSSDVCSSDLPATTAQSERGVQPPKIASRFAGGPLSAVARINRVRSVGAVDWPEPPQDRYLMRFLTNALAGRTRAVSAAILSVAGLFATALPSGAGALDLPGLSADGDRYERRLLDKAPPQANPAAQAAAKRSEEHTSEL